LGREEGGEERCKKQTYERNGEFKEDFCIKLDEDWLRSVLRGTSGNKRPSR
jgi:hypothetical protein